MLAWGVWEWLSGHLGWECLAGLGGVGLTGLAFLGCADRSVSQGSSLHVGSDLLKFEEPVSVQGPGTFFFRTPKVWPWGQPGC